MSSSLTHILLIVHHCRPPNNSSVEQPIGTGFSYGDFPQDEHDVSTDMYAFMQNFYKVFPHLAQYDFFVTGESYAGMFIPSIARHFNLENKKAATDTSRIVIPLKGASLGNGWIEATTQGPAVIDYSWWHGLIDKPTRDALHVEWTNCMAVWEGKVKPGDDAAQQPPPFHNFNVQDDCAIMWGVLQASGFPNAYDISTWDPNVDQVTFASEVFYNNAVVKAALHAPEGIVWHGCREGGGRRRKLSEEQHRRLYMDNDRPLSVVPYIADLVDDGIPVLVYNGDRDMTTNMVGTELALNAMSWKGKDEWLDASRGLWMVDGQQAGWSKEHGKLTFLTVYNSGHMVPYNVPGPAFDMLLRVLTHKSFMDVELPTLRVKPISTSSTSKTTDLLSDVSGESTAAAWVPVLSGEHAHTVGVAAISMMAGFVLAMVLVRRSGQGYHRVPNVSLTV
jgi:serine carboxypeptidase-like clade IV